MKTNDDMTCREFVEKMLGFMAINNLDHFVLKDDNGGEEFLVEYDRLVKALEDDRLDD